MTVPLTHTNTGDKHWQSVYLSTLDNLRSAWPHAWPGLPVIVQACIQRLWPSHPPWAKPNSGQLLHAAMSMAQRMERAASVAGYEPHYHNRLHTADALTAICLFIEVLKLQSIAVDDDWAAALLLAVVSHDVLHPGGANGFLQEFEQRSASEMKALAEGFAIEAVWLQRVSEMILRTDPTLVAANHDKVKHTDFSMNLDWACVLINEADILASATECHGPDLGHALAQEWALCNHPLHHVVGTPQGRLQFLTSLRFSTPASAVFQIADSVQRQRMKLQGD